MKILYVTTIGLTMNFFKEIIKDLVDRGDTVDIACNEDDYQVDDFFRGLGCRIFQIDWTRSPVDKNNIRAIKEIRHVAIENGYDIVHCHTPIAGVCTRVACKGLRKDGLKVFYTAHGFHFYKGAPLKNWLLYYPIEKICAHWTDVLITINKEDYERAKKKLKAGNVAYLPGVGVDSDKFTHAIVDSDLKKRELGIPDDSKIILSVGELNENKNHKLVICALGKINDSRIHYIIAGVGNQKEELEVIAREQNVNLHLLGYRHDIGELYRIADLYIHPSYREGLPVALMEAISAKTSCICSDIRGCKDLMELDRFDPHNADELTKLISAFLYENRRNSACLISKIKEFDVKVINKKMIDLYCCGG